MRWQVERVKSEERVVGLNPLTAGTRVCVAWKIRGYYVWYLDHTSTKSVTEESLVKQTETDFTMYRAESLNSTTKIAVK